MLRDADLMRTQHDGFRVCLVARLDEGLVNRGPCLTIVVSLEILDIFQEGILRFLGLQDAEYIKEECTPCIIEPALMTGMREGLTGKAAAEYVEIRNRGNIEFGNIVVRLNAEIGPVYFAAFGINVASKDTGCPKLRESQMKSTDTTKEIDEFEGT
jgi:hypothetical protein